MSDYSSVYIIIPVYNEASMLRDVILSLQMHGFFQIVIVDDGSTEDVFYGISDLPHYYLRHRSNLGQGAALQTGFDYVKRFNPDIVITFDADGQHDVNDLELLLGPIRRREADITLGSRFLTRDQQAPPAVRKWILKLARLINGILTGIWLSDAHNGLRAMNRKALDTILLRENRMAHASELLYHIRKNKLRYQEIPVNIRYTTYSRKKGQTSTDSIKILFDLVLHKFFR